MAPPTHRAQRAPAHQAHRAMSYFRADLCFETYLFILHRQVCIREKTNQDYIIVSRVQLQLCQSMFWLSSSAAKGSRGITLPPDPTAKAVLTLMAPGLNPKGCNISKMHLSCGPYVTFLSFFLTFRVLGKKNVSFYRLIPKW